MGGLSKTETITVAGILALTALVMALYFYADYRILHIDTAENRGTKLDRHYAFISQGESDLWSSVFQAGAQQAQSNKAYLEWIGKDSPVAYTIEDCMRIATAAGVDGIILHKTASDQLADLIEEAHEENIPVVTVLVDEEESDRISFIGMNNYQAGERYAEQIIDCLRPGSNHVLVISDSPLGEGGTGLMYSQMIQATEQGKDQDQKIIFDSMEIKSVTSFDTEEAVRDIFVREGDIPDIIVCLDLTTTECVSQALVDYNKVGEVAVIGFYASDMVTEAISRGIVHSTLGLDADEIGKVSVDALDEYWSLGRVSSYFNVGLSVINADTITED